MSSINSVVVSGYLGNDAILETKESSSLMKFSLACTEKYKDYQKTNWFDCYMWGPRAEGLAQYCTKGTHCIVRGKLRQSTWTNKEGKTRSKIEIQIEEFVFISSKKKEEEKYFGEWSYDNSQKIAN